MEGDNPPQNYSNNNSEENRASNNYFFPYSYSFIRRAPSFFSPFISFREVNLNRGASNEREETGFPGRTSLRIISSTYSNIGRNPELAPQPKIDPDEMREVIAQNLLEVQNLIEFGNYNEFIENENEEKNSISDGKEKEGDYNMNCFNLNKRILAKGQWVDVKDTVDQWLDAQVIEVSEDNKMVKIHYNHWSTRWDEWIQTNSPRIMPFRYHTRQSTLTNYHSPYPNKKPDMGVTLLSFENLNKNSCVDPVNTTQLRNRNSSVISTSSPQSQNNQNNQNNNNNSNNPPPPSSQSSNAINISTNEINTNSNNAISTSSRNEISSNSNIRRQNHIRYAEPLPPIPSPKQQQGKTCETVLRCSGRRLSVQSRETETIRILKKHEDHGDGSKQHRPDRGPVVYRYLWRQQV